MLIKNFVHYPGVHCESTTIRDLVAFNGLRLSEPMVFGLGSGLSFIYWNMKKMPFPFVGGRIRPEGLMKNLSETIGFDLTVEETKSAEKAQSRLNGDLSRGTPVGLKLDMFYLDYFKHPPHFASHNIVACGFSGNNIFVADTDFKDFQRVSFDNLKKARSAKGAFSSSNLSFKFANVPKDIHFSKCIKTAVRKTAEQMLNPPIKNLGIAGIRKFSKEILGWRDGFGHHCTMFEKAGTGGAGFRNLYCGFLKESMKYMADEKLAAAYNLYSDIALAWTKISERIRDAPKSKNMDSELSEISQMIYLQADKEEEAMKYLSRV